MELGMNYSLKIKTSSSVGNYEIIKMFIYALENKGFFKHLHEPDLTKTGWDKMAISDAIQHAK